MFTIAKNDTSWSDIGIRVLIGSIVASVVLAILDGYLRGPYLESHYQHHDLVVMFYTWALDFRYLADQAIYAATIFVVGAKFIETRSILTIGFDRLDSAQIKLNGPDEDNVVWIGRRYNTPLEAQAVAETLTERLKENAQG